MVGNPLVIDMDAVTRVAKAMEDAANSRKNYVNFKCKKRNRVGFAYLDKAKPPQMLLSLTVINEKGLIKLVENLSISTEDDFSYSLVTFQTKKRYAKAIEQSLAEFGKRAEESSDFDNYEEYAKSFVQWFEEKPKTTG